MTLNNLLGATFVEVDEYKNIPYTLYLELNGVRYAVRIVSETIRTNEFDANSTVDVPTYIVTQEG